MAMISLKVGGTFFGKIIDHDWKGKFLVVDISEVIKGEKQVVHWNNVSSIIDRIEGEEEAEK